MSINVGSVSTAASPKIHPVLPSSIQAGDRIEIKVWDRKSHNPNQTQSSSASASAATAYRQRTPQRGGVSLSSTAATVKTTVAGGANTNTSRDLAKVASRLQQQMSTSVHPPQQQQQQQDGITHLLSKRPPMGPRSTSVGTSTGTGGGTSHGASPSAKSGAGFGSGDDANRHPFILPQRSYSDVSDASNAIIPPGDFASSISPPGATSASGPQHASSTKDLDNNVLNKNNHGHGPGGLSVIQPLSAHDQVPGTSSATGDIPNDLQPTHSRMSSSASALTTNSNLTAEDSLLSTTMTAVPGSAFGSGSIRTPDRKPADLQEEFEQQPQPLPHDPLEEISQTHIMRKSFVAAVTERSLTALKPDGRTQIRTQISILRNVAELYGLISYDLVTITRIGKNLEEDVVSDCQADFVTVSNDDCLFLQFRIFCCVDCLLTVVFLLWYLFIIPQFSPPITFAASSVYLFTLIVLVRLLMNITGVSEGPICVTR